MTKSRMIRQSTGSRQLISPRLWRDGRLTAPWIVVASPLQGQQETSDASENERRADIVHMTQLSPSSLLTLAFMRFPGG